MKIVFYAPLKSPEHAVPSGDRQMARALIKALELAGHEVQIASHLRSFSKTPHSSEIKQAAGAEAARIVGQWKGAKPDLWFSYHPYYKAPDFIALEVGKSLNLPIVTAEASLAVKRDRGEWAASQACVRQLLTQSAANFYFTDRDIPGLLTETTDVKLVHLPPFIDIAEQSDTVDSSEKSGPVKLIAIGMMRAGVKIESYALLARSLHQIENADWQLLIVGDGKERRDVERLFSAFAKDKVSWVGEVNPADVPSLLCQSDIFVWPGYGEAYGLAYLEAQAAGLPVVAQDTHGVPFAVQHDNTGILVRPDDEVAFSQAVLKLIEDQKLREKFGSNAAKFVRSQRSLAQASIILDETIKRVCR